MGNYATEAQFKDRFESERTVAYLTDDEVTGTPDSAVITEINARSEGLINSYLARRYATPVSTSDTQIANLLNGLTLDLMVYYAFARPGVEITDRMQRLFDQTIGFLREIVSGNADLPGASAPATPVSREPLMSFGTASVEDESNRMFSRDSMSAL